MGSEKAGILANNIHDVGGYNGLVVFSSFLLTQTQQVLRKTDEKHQWAGEAKTMNTVNTSNTVFVLIHEYNHCDVKTGN